MRRGSFKMRKEVFGMRKGFGATDVICLFAGAGLGVALTMAAGYFSQMERYLDIQAAESVYIEAVHANEQARLFMETAVDFILAFAVDDVSAHGGIASVNSSQENYRDVPIGEKVLYWRWCEFGGGGASWTPPEKTYNEVYDDTLPLCGRVPEDYTGTDCHCAVDCYEGVCNNDGICQDSESCATCEDCRKEIDEGTVLPSDGEGLPFQPADGAGKRTIVCGDGCCEWPHEMPQTCPRDCFECGNGVCQVKLGPQGEGEDRYQNCGEPPEDCGQIGTNKDVTLDEVSTSTSVLPPNTRCIPQESKGMTQCQCKEDCGVGVCGDGFCDIDETCENCPQDCGPGCGNGYCEPRLGENSRTCPRDCFSCGNGICEKINETRQSDFCEEPKKPEDCSTCRERELGSGFPSIGEIYSESLSTSFGNKTDAYALLFTKNELEHPTIVNVSETGVFLDDGTSVFVNGSVVTWTQPLSIALRTNQLVFGTVNTSSSNWRADDCADIWKLWDNLGEITDVCRDEDSSRFTSTTYPSGKVGEEMEVACTRVPYPVECCEHTIGGTNYVGSVDYNVTAEVVDLSCTRQLVSEEGIIEKPFTLIFNFQYREELESYSEC